MLSEKSTTILAAIAAGLAFILMAAGTDQAEVPGWVVLIVGTINSMIVSVLGKTHPGKK